MMNQMAKEVVKMTEIEIYKYFIKQGLTIAGTCGLMGNLYAESHLQSNNLQDSYNKKFGISDDEYTKAVDLGLYKDFVGDHAGYGFSQLTFWSRKQKYYNFVKKRGVSISDPMAQLDFLMLELQTSYKSVYNVLISTDDVKIASDAVLTQFEKPKDQSDAVKKLRYSYSKGYYDKYANKTSETVSEPYMGDLDIKYDYPCHKSNYGAFRQPESIKYIVLHYTGNRTDKAVNNAKYFHNTADLKCSAHYFSDSTSIYQSVDNNHVAYAVGKLYSKSNGGGKYWGIVTNQNSISIELCSQNGVILEETIDRAVQLVRLLMQKYHIPVNNIVTHFMVCGKNCPGWTLNTPEALEMFKAKTASNSSFVINKGFNYKARVNVKSSLNVRSGPSMSHIPVGSLKNGDVVEIVEEKNGFGRIKDTQKWVSLSYLVKEVM